MCRCCDWPTLWSNPLPPFVVTAITDDASQRFISELQVESHDKCPPTSYMKV